MNPDDARDARTALIRALPTWQLAVLRLNERIAADLGIAGSDLQCLFVLDRGGPTTPGALARRIGLTTGSVSRMVDRLVAADLVTRTADTRDRRRLIVAIRPHAARRLHRIYDPIDDELDGLLRGIDAEALERWRRFVEEATAATDARGGVDPAS